nr:type II secretion system F family protein [Candidatus Njordarchaeum guaymaensis]
MKITRKTLKRIAIASSVAAAALLMISIFFYGFSPDFDYLLIVVFTVGVAPTSFASIIHNRWKNKIEKAMPEFLRDLATSIRTGVPIHAALEHTSKRMYGPLTNELKILVAHMSWGMNFEEALTELSKRVDLPLVKKATILILEAGRHGGDLSDIFESTAQYIDNVNTWNLRRKMQTMPYVAIFYFAVALFLFIIILISRMIFIPISELAKSGVPLLRPILTPTQARRVFLHTSLLESFFGGILAGKINEDSFAGGL